MCEYCGEEWDLCAVCGGCENCGDCYCHDDDDFEDDQLELPLEETAGLAQIDAALAGLRDAGRSASPLRARNLALQAEEVDGLAKEFSVWQDFHPNVVKLPD